MGDGPPPAVRVVLPDGQEIRGVLHARQETPSGWRYWTGLPLWQNVGTEGEGIEPAEYRVWLSPNQVRPLDGVTYDVPTHRLPTTAPPDTRWAWTVQRLRGPDGRSTPQTVVHVYDCEHSPRGASELNLDEALDALQRPGARACKECGAAEALTPLL